MAKIKVLKEVDVKTLIVKAGVRYYEDATVNGIEDTEGNLIPCKNGELWCLVIDIESGVIKNWKQGVTADVHYKVCDQCSIYLHDENANTVFSIENDYVPNILCPEGEGYGDYIKMKIDETGKIANWKSDLSSFDHE